MDNVPDWKDGVGLAALALMSALLDRLRRRGIFEDSEVVEIIGSALVYVDEADAESFLPEVTAQAKTALKDMQRSFDPDAPEI